MPFPGGVLTGEQDCMVFISSDRAGQSGCDYGSHRAIFCESQGIRTNRSLERGVGNGLLENSRGWGVAVITPSDDELSHYLFF